MFGRRIMRGLLVAGVVLGFGSGVMHMARHGAHCHASRFEARKHELMDEFAQSCVEAARRGHDPAHTGPHGGPAGFAPPFHGGPPPAYAPAPPAPAAPPPPAAIAPAPSPNAGPPAPAA